MYMTDMETQAERAVVLMAQAKISSEHELRNAKLSCRRQSESANQTIPVPDENLPFSRFAK